MSQFVTDFQLLLLLHFSVHVSGKIGEEKCVKFDSKCYSLDKILSINHLVRCGEYGYMPDFMYCDNDEPKHCRVLCGRGGDQGKRDCQKQCPSYYECHFGLINDGNTLMCKRKYPKFKKKRTTPPPVTRLPSSTDTSSSSTTPTMNTTVTEVKKAQSDIAVDVVEAPTKSPEDTNCVSSCFAAIILAVVFAILFVVLACFVLLPAWIDLRRRCPGLWKYYDRYYDRYLKVRRTQYQNQSEPNESTASLTPQESQPSEVSKAGIA